MYIYNVKNFDLIAKNPAYLNFPTDRVTC